MTAVVIDAGFEAVVLSSSGHIAGEGVGIVTLDNVPGRAMIDLFRRADHVWLRRQFSGSDGSYRFTGLDPEVLHDVVGRDITDTWDDVIVGRVLPYRPISIYGNAPTGGVGEDYLFTYLVRGGEPPYEFTLTGDLPDGLDLVATDMSVAISGTVSAFAVDETFSIEVVDARGASASIVDTIAVSVVLPHEYWRVNVTASNNHASICELEMAESSGGANQCVGGTSLSGGDYPGSYSKANAFNGSLANPPWAAAVPGAGWLGYHFAAPVRVGEVRICAAMADNESPRDFTIEWSDDGVTWNVAATYAGEATWPTAAFRAFAV